MFAERTNWQLAPNAITRLRQDLERAGTPILDLTESNPTRIGLSYPKELPSFLSSPEVLTYAPSPKGDLSAREAVASIYRAKGAAINPEAVFLTASTSEAYGFLFRLLAEPGDAVLVPRPSYPLLEYVAGLNDLHTVSYPLRYTSRWALDLKALSQAITPRTKLIIAVHPNNPTGSCLTPVELESVVKLCQERGLSLVADEVFSEYLYEEKSEIPKTLTGSREILTFALGGLSKFSALPQMKLAWMAASGPADLLREALARLEVIADTFLSVSTPIQHAFPQWLRMAPLIQDQIRARLAANRQFLQKRLASQRAVEYLDADGGWNAVLKVPSLKEEEEFVLRFLEKERLLVHPGYFFDFDEPGFLVASLLIPEKEFQEGIQRLLRHI